MKSNKIIKKTNKKTAVLAKKNENAITERRYDKNEVYKSVILSKGNDEVKIEAMSINENGKNEYKLTIQPKNGKEKTISDFKDVNSLINGFDKEVESFEKKGYKTVLTRSSREYVSFYSSSGNKTMADWFDDFW